MRRRKTVDVAMVLVLLSSAPAALAGGSIGSAVSCADQNGLIGPCGTTIGKQLRTWSGVEIKTFV